VRDCHHTLVVDFNNAVADSHAAPLSDATSEQATYLRHKKKSASPIEPKMSKKTHHSVLHAKPQLIFCVWPLDFDLHHRGARNNSQFDYGLGFSVLQKNLISRGDNFFKFRCIP